MAFYLHSFHQYHHQVTLIVVIVMGNAERIKEIEDEMARTQKNKATEFHMGQLKAKLAKLRTQLL